MANLRRESLCQAAGVTEWQGCFTRIQLSVFSLIALHRAGWEVLRPFTPYYRALCLYRPPLYRVLLNMMRVSGDYETKTTLYKQIVKVKLSP
jgi:hypothetical protein